MTKKVSARVPAEWGTERMTQWREFDGKRYVTLNGRPTMYPADSTDRSLFARAVTKLAHFEDAAEAAALKSK